jgi:hypothetical protein
VRKIEHFKSMIKAMKDKKVATADQVVNDVLDSNSTPEVPKDQLNVGKESVLNKTKDKKSRDQEIEGAKQPDHAPVAENQPKKTVADLIREKEVKDKPMAKADGSNKAPNTWFHYNHPAHGKIEVSAHVPDKINGSNSIKIHGVGAPGDLHISPDEAGIDKKHLAHMTLLAAAHGQGDHMKKSEENKEDLMNKHEYTAEEIIQKALENVKAKQDLKKAEEMKREEGKAEDTGSIYNEEQEVGNQNDIQEAAKRDTARLNGKKLKEFMEKQKNKAEKKAKSPIKEEK